MLKNHHYAWLSKHPLRSAGWLEDRLRDGFDVHHLDRDRENNAPENLVLIEHGDHMIMHGCPPGFDRTARGAQGVGSRVSREARQELLLGELDPDYEIGRDAFLNRRGRAISEERGIPYKTVRKLAHRYQHWAWQERKKKES